MDYSVDGSVGGWVDAVQRPLQTTIVVDVVRHNSEEFSPFVYGIIQLLAISDTTIETSENPSD